MEAKVLQEERLAVLELHRHPLRLLADAVGSELHVHAEQLRDVGEDIFHRELGVGSGLRATEVGGDDEPTAVTDDLLEGGEGSTDAGVVGDLEIIVQRDVEVDTHEDALTAEVVVLDLCHSYRVLLVY